MLKKLSGKIKDSFWVELLCYTIVMVYFWNVENMGIITGIIFLIIAVVEFVRGVIAKKLYLKIMRLLIMYVIATGIIVRLF